MVTVEEALKIIQDQSVNLKTENRYLEDCPGFSLSKNITAPFDMPSFDNSAMDGYALCGIYTEYRIHRSAEYPVLSHTLWPFITLAG